MNGSLLNYDISSKVLLLCTPTTILEKEKSNSSSFSEAITGKLCTQFKIEESLENFCIEWKERFYSTTKIWMSSSGSAIWDIRYLTHFWSSRRRSHSKETFFNSNWLCRRLCFLFILNNFIRENRGWDVWINNSCGFGCRLQISIMILIVHAKGYIQFCSEILWVFKRFNKVAQA